MRQNANNRRSRGRGGRKSGNPRNQTFDSNGPGARVRGNASQIYEKYQQLARDAASSGDRIASENYLQHAEHYFRVMNANNPRPEQRGGEDDSQDDSMDDDVVDQEAYNDSDQVEDNAEEQEQPKPKRNGAKANGRGRRPRKADRDQDDVSDDDDARGASVEVGEESEATSA